MRDYMGNLLGRLGVFLSAFFLKRANNKYMKKMRDAEDKIEVNARKIRMLEVKLGRLMADIKRLAFYFSKTANKQYRLSHQNRLEMKEWVRRRKR